MVGEVTIYLVFKAERKLREPGSSPVLQISKLGIGGYTYMRHRSIGIVGERTISPTVHTPSVLFLSVSPLHTCSHSVVNLGAPHTAT